MANINPHDPTATTKLTGTADLVTGIDFTASPIDTSGESTTAAIKLDDNTAGVRIQCTLNATAADMAALQGTADISAAVSYEGFGAAASEFDLDPVKQTVPLTYDPATDTIEFRVQVPSESDATNPRKTGAYRVTAVLFGENKRLLPTFVTDGAGNVIFDPVTGLPTNEVQILPLPVAAVVDLGVIQIFDK